MKLRLLVLTAALLGFSYAAPWSFSQDQGSATPSGQSASNDTAQSDQVTPPPPAVQPADPDKVKHDGGKNDVDAIGNRRMGNQYAQMVEASSKMVTDPVVTEYVNRIGQNLVRNSDAQVPFTIKVIDS